MPPYRSVRIERGVVPEPDEPVGDALDEPRRTADVHERMLRRRHHRGLEQLAREAPGGVGQPSGARRV